MANNFVSIFLLQIIFLLYACFVYFIDLLRAKWSCIYYVTDKTIDPMVSTVHFARDCLNLTNKPILHLL